VRPLADSHTGAAVVFYVLLGLFVLLEQRVRVRSILNRDGERRDAGSFFVVVAFIGVGVGGAFALGSDVTGAAIPVGRWPLFGCGLALMVAGIVLRQWSVALLGKSFTVDVRVQEGQQVIDHGPYRFVRHPSYTGMLLTFAGIGLALGNWLSIACVLLVPLVGLVGRIRVEERVLLGELGEPYQRYAEGRARLVPHVW
jgi:protein-S-isoprenylcysteine O-methyltransferase Ste14